MVVRFNLGSEGEGYSGVLTSGALPALGYRKARMVISEDMVMICVFDWRSKSEIECEVSLYISPSYLSTYVR